MFYIYPEGEMSKIVAFILIVFCVNNTQALGNNEFEGEYGGQSAVDYVVPIDWGRFDINKNPKSEEAIHSRDLLLNSVKYGLSWIVSLPKYSNGLFNLGGIKENHIRPPASEVVGLAVALQTGIYNEDHIELNKQDAINATVLLIKSIAKAHKCNTENGWGDQWQSALWCGLAGQAAYMMWNYLDNDTKMWVAAMVEYEANRFNIYTVPYYKNKDGKVVYEGDSKGEENSWNATVLQLAVSMMPEHPNVADWRYKCVELMVSAYARPTDLKRSKQVDGFSLSEWLSGSNLEENGTLINHGFIHNDYICTIEQNLRAINMFSLGDIDIPEATNLNADIIYDALVNLNFASPPYQSPGGTMYIEGSPDQYYPNGTDWSRYRYDIYYVLDVFAQILNFDDYAGTDGLSWEKLRAKKLLTMQARHSDKRVYASGEWNNYGGKEQLAAWMFGDAYLLKWLKAQEELSETVSWNLQKPISEKVNDDEDEVKYSSGWIDNNSAPNRIDYDEHYTNITGGNVQFKFTGTEIKWIATKFSNRGEADVYIDGIFITSIDLYAPYPVYMQEVFTQKGLENTEHQIEIVCKGTKNKASTDYYIDVDAFIYSNNSTTNILLDIEWENHVKVYPNPATDVVSFEYYQKQSGLVYIYIYNGMGKLVVKQFFEVNAGLQVIRVKLKNGKVPINSGIYLYQINSNKTVENGKLIVR